MTNIDSPPLSRPHIHRSHHIILYYNVMLEVLEWASLLEA